VELECEGQEGQLRGWSFGGDTWVAWREPDERVCVQLQ
jgi:hypothetical protein